MSSDIIPLLQLDKTLTSKVIVVKEINKCASSFIISCVLNHCIKNKTGVLLASTHDSVQHYQNVGLRMNYNLQRYMDTGFIDFLNVGEYCVNNILNSDDNNNLNELFLNVKDRITTMKQKHASVCVIFDGISHLFDLNYSLKEVNIFCKQVIKFVRSEHNSFTVFHCNEANNDDETFVLSSLLSHQAHTVLEVENLPSGLSADVSGHLSIRYPGAKYNHDHIYSMDVTPSRYLFKLFDRGVKLFAPGTV